MSEFFYADKENYDAKCRGCGRSDSLKRERAITEREYIILDDSDEADITGEVADNDTDGMSEWKFSCDSCGLEGDDFEDILAMALWVNCPVCDGDGEDSRGNDCHKCDGNGEVRE